MALFTVDLGAWGVQKRGVSSSLCFGLWVCSGAGNTEARPFRPDCRSAWFALAASVSNDKLLCVLVPARSSDSVLSTLVDHQLEVDRSDPVLDEVIDVLSPGFAGDRDQDSLCKKGKGESNK